jgi:hypothetical protein
MVVNPSHNIVIVFQSSHKITEVFDRVIISLKLLNEVTTLLCICGDIIYAVVIKPSHNIIEIIESSLDIIEVVKPSHNIVYDLSFLVKS